MPKGSSTKKYWDSLSPEQKEKRLSFHVIPTHEELQIRLHGEDGRKTWSQERLQNPVLHEYNVWRRFVHYRGFLKTSLSRLIEAFKVDICDGCGQKETSMNQAGTGVRALNIDHDHATMELRGSLCNRCNNVVARVDDNPELLEKLSAYLRKSRS
jgi:Recombination endonuclease VII